MKVIKCFYSQDEEVAEAVQESVGVVPLEEEEGAPRGHLNHR